MPFIARSRLLRRRVEAIYSCGFRKHFDRDPTSSEQLSIVALVEGTLLVLAHSWRGAGTAKLTIPRWQFAMLGLLGDAAPAFLTKIEADLREMFKPTNIELVIEPSQIAPARSKT